MAAPSKNTASVSDMAKAMRACLTGLGAAYQDPDYEKVVEGYQELLTDLSKLTPRVNKDVVARAARIVFTTATDGECRMFGERIAGAFMFVKQKKRSMTTGKKLTSSVLRVVQTLPSASPPMKPSLGSQLMSHAKQRHKELLKASPQRGSKAAPSNPDEQDGRAFIFAKYGLEMPKRSPSMVSIDDEAVSISSAEEVPKLGNQAAAAQGGSSSSEPLAVVLEHFDPSQKAVVRVLSNGQQICSDSVRPGQHGFLEAVFGSEIVQTEIPALMLAEPAAVMKAVMKKPAAAPKRPAAQASAAEGPTKKAKHEDADQELIELLEEMADTKAPGLPSPPVGVVGNLGMAYSNPYRYKDGRYAIRRKFGNKAEIMAGRGKSMPEAAVKALLCKAVEKLTAGEQEATVKAWFKSELN